MGEIRVDSYFLLQSPLQPLLITTTYLLLVLKIGPHFMSKRKRFDLITPVRVYNVLQIICNSSLFLMGVKLLPHFCIWCYPSDQDPEINLQIFRLYYLCEINKILDLVETIFFVLRKKMEQVSLLHVFHHVGLIWVVWFNLKYFQGAYSILPVVLNSFVHVFMYLYYLQSSRKKAMNKLWKQCMTSLQIGHQLPVFVVYVLCFVAKKSLNERLFFGAVLAYGATVIYLFLKLFKEAYTSRKL